MFRDSREVWLARGALLSGLLWLAAGGCGQRPVPGTVEDSLTSGRIRIVCAPEALPLVAGLAADFMRQYPAARLELEPGPSRAAIGALFAAECGLAVITRELTEEERAAGRRGGLGLDGYRFARDAVAVVVHAENPVENMSVDDLRRIYLGELTRWTERGGRDEPIEPVARASETDLADYFAGEVLEGGAIAAPAHVAASDSEVVALVTGNRRAIGWVSLAGLRAPAKSLYLSRVTGLPYWQPDLEAVYRGDYPLTRYYNLYVRQDGPKLAAGFVTFVTSAEGQRHVRDAGLLPTAVPVRFVRRAPLMSGHR